jgi:hypothetical protein
MSYSHLALYKTSVEFYKNFNRNDYFKDIETLLKNKNILDNSLAELLLFEIIFKFNYFCSFDEISKFLNLISININNINLKTRQIQFINFYKE